MLNRDKGDLDKKHGPHGHHMEEHATTHYTGPMVPGTMQSHTNIWYPQNLPSHLSSCPSSCSPPYTVLSQVSFPSPSFLPQPQNLWKPMEPSSYLSDKFVDIAPPQMLYRHSYPSQKLQSATPTLHQYKQQSSSLSADQSPLSSSRLPEPSHPIKNTQQSLELSETARNNQYRNNLTQDDFWMYLSNNSSSNVITEEKIKIFTKDDMCQPNTSHASVTEEFKIETKEIEDKTEIFNKQHQKTEVKQIQIRNAAGIKIDLRKEVAENIRKEYNMSRNHKDKYENSNPRRMYTLMCPEDYQSGKKSHWSELEITGSIRNLSPNLWQMTHLTALYLNDNSLQRVPCEIGRLINLRILDLSNNKLRSLPAELGELIYLRELLLNQNYLRVLPYELGKLFQLQVLGLQGNPLSKDVMTLYGNGEPTGTNKLLTYMLDNLQVTANHPPQRPWIPLTRPNRTRPTCIFTVMCYNVLCDKYATRQMYGYCPSWALDWEYRKKGILDEIRHYAADIISLQEVETDQFYNFFLPELKHDGYDGIFSPKSRAKTMAENDRKYVDGCAIFYRTAKFSLIKEHLVEFNQLAMANAEGSDNMLNRVMPKDNIGLAALLRTKEAAWDNGVPSDPAQVQQPILVCTAHIHWDPEFCDVKLIQTMMLSNELRSILDQAGQSFRPGHKPDSSNVQLLLCGDFNSLPDSGVIEFLTSGRVAADHRDFKDLAYKSCLQKISGCDKPNEFTHSFKLASAYSEDIMPYTNYTFEFKGIIDYIFYSKQSMVPLGLLGPLSPEWFKEHKVVGCPHPHVPSDHFPLLVELEMTPTVGTSNGLISRR